MVGVWGAALLYTAALAAGLGAVRGLAGAPCGMWVAPVGSSFGGEAEGTQSLSATNPVRLRTQ